MKNKKTVLKVSIIILIPLIIGIIVVIIVAIFGISIWKTNVAAQKRAKCPQTKSLIADKATFR